MIFENGKILLILRKPWEGDAENHADNRMPIACSPRLG